VNPAPSLRDLQLWLKWIVTDPRGVEDALRDPTPTVKKYRERYTQPGISHLPWVETSTASSTSRLSIYAEGYFSRILECLENDFSRTKNAIGEEAFTKLVAEYLKVFPSCYTSIDEVGNNFARFVSQFKDFSLPGWVPTLAAFEWSYVEAFYASEPTDSCATWRQEMSAGHPVQFRVHPAVRLLQSDWMLTPILDGAATSASQKSSGLIIYRFDDHVLWEDLDLGFLQILQNLKNEISLEESLSQFQNVDPETVSKNFSHWMEQGILYGTLGNTLDKDENNG